MSCSISFKACHRSTVKVVLYLFKSSNTDNTQKSYHHTQRLGPTFFARTLYIYSMTTKGGGMTTSTIAATAAATTTASGTTKGGGVVSGSSSKNPSSASSATTTTTTTTTTPTTDWLYHVIWSTILLYMTYVAIQQAYTIRLRAIQDYGPVIHEFDPYFNYRATEVRALIYMYRSERV